MGIQKLASLYNTSFTPTFATLLVPLWDKARGWDVSV